MCFARIELRNPKSLTFLFGMVEGILPVMNLLLVAHRILFASVVALSFSGARAFCQNAGEVSPDQLLLKDYRPRSIYRVPVTRVEKARFPVIDVHSHPYVQTPSQVEQWIRNMDEVGIEKSIVMVGATGKTFDDAIRLFGPHPDRFEVWCGIDYAGFDQPGFAERAIAELERCQRLGAVGVGELSDKGRGLRGVRGNPDGFPMHIDDPRMDPVLERCADLRLPVNIHIGEDQWMYEPMDRHNDGLMNSFKWRIPGDPDVLGHDDILATLDTAVSRHPRVMFIACHLANTCHDLSMIGGMFDRHPNLYADLGARYGELAPIPRQVKAFLDRYQDRIFYGTDMGIDVEMYRITFRVLETHDEHFYPEQISNYHWAWHGFGLEDPVLKKIYGDNARRVFKRLRDGN